jgi:hypothetical protein
MFPRALVARDPAQIAAAQTTDTFSGLIVLAKDIRTSVN